MRIIFFTNGCTAVFKNGQQVAHLQESWLNLYMQWLETQGVNPLSCFYELPDGTYAVPSRTDEGFTFTWSVQTELMCICGLFKADAPHVCSGRPLDTDCEINTKSAPTVGDVLAIRKGDPYPPAPDPFVSQ